MENINPKAKESLQLKLNEILNACEIIDGLPNMTLGSEAMQRFAKQTLTLKKEWLTESDIYFITCRRVASAVQLNQERGQVLVDGPLNKALSPEALKNLADKCLNYFLSIPREYIIYFPLPSFKAESSIIELSPDIFLKRFLEGEPNVSTTRNFLQPMDNFNLSLFKPNQWYIGFKEVGYFSGNIEDISFHNASSKLKRILYLGLLRGFFCEKDPHPWTTAFVGLGLDNVLGSLKAIGMDNEPASYKYAISLPEPISKLLSRVCLNTEDANFLEFVHDLSNDIHKYINKALHIPAQLCSGKFESDDITSITTAIEWAFDAKTNENQTVSFIQTCIALEAILGEDTKKGQLSATLADRCAYLISPRIADRRKIRDYFEKIYDVRSKLVHGRRIRLSHDDRDSLHKAQSLLNSVINKEISNIGFPK
jgi:hypothetical protein